MFNALTPGVLNVLTKDTTNSYWTEATPFGQVTAYPVNTSGMITSASYIQSAAGVIHTLSYASGRLGGVACLRLVFLGSGAMPCSSGQAWRGSRANASK